VAPTATKVANDPQLPPYSPKEKWLAIAMGKSQIPVPTVHLAQDNVNQGLQQPENV